MFDVSDRFLDAVGRSHRSVTEVDILFDREVILADLAVTGGSVTMDSNSEVRGRCQLTFAEPQRVPSGPTSVLSPYGYEVAIRRGIDFEDGTAPEMVPLGVFAIQVSETDAETLLTDVSGEDRTRQVKDALFEDDVEVVSGTNVATAITAVVSAGVDGLEYFLPSTPHTVLQAVMPANSDRWQPVVDMATSVGWDIFFGGIGELTARPESTLADTPVWTIDEADADGVGGVLLGGKMRLDRGPAYNRQPVASSNSSAGAVFKAVAVDNDPASPSYYYGPFGKKSAPLWTSEWISSDAMAQDAADARLARALGVARSIDFRSLVNPALRIGDVVIVERAVLDLDEPQIIDAYTIGLGPEDVMSGRCRSQQVLP
jgi:hypothetical protein